MVYYYEILRERIMSMKNGLLQACVISFIFLFFSALCTAQDHPEIEGFVYIDSGTFQMGSNDSIWEDEKPSHQVSISKGFYLSTHEVTQKEWFDVMGTRPWLDEDGNPREYVQVGDNFPAVYISWNDAISFIAAKNAAEGQNIYRLPTEAEWEFACRAATTTSYSFGDNESDLDDYAWWRGNAWDEDQKYAHEVMTKLANPWGLFDMHGNIWEWCSDWYSDSYYAVSPAVDPTGPENGQAKVVRGGSFMDTIGADACRSAKRFAMAPAAATADTGFRILRMTEPLPDDNDGDSGGGGGGGGCFLKQVTPW